MNRRSLPLWFWMTFFIILPLALIIFFAFFEKTTEGVVFSTKFITTAIRNPDYMRTMWYSIWIALLSTVACLVLGYPLAMILSTVKIKLRNFMLILFILPMWMNFLIRTYALMAILEDNGTINSMLKFIGLPTIRILGTDWAIIIGMVYNFLPFMVFPIYTIMLKIDKGIIEAAQDLGANSLTVFSKVILPLSIPGIISGVMMVFMPAVTTFIIPQLLNNKSWTIGTLIEMQFKGDAYNPNLGSAISLILMVLIVIGMSILNKFDHEHEAGGIL